jgi:hypothetical protein
LADNGRKHGSNLLKRDFGTGFEQVIANDLNVFNDLKVLKISKTKKTKRI